jgi:type VI secretion system protein ImpK
MREEMAGLVYPVFRHGLRTLDRLRAGDKLDLAKEQADLKGLLKTATEARRWPDYGGDGERFLGVRYALACWLDEVFILYSPWGEAWNEAKLETALYGTTERAFRFWEQAHQAESRGEADALEAFYLCVMLGFRGEYRDDPRRLADWREAVEAQFGRSGPRDWPGPPELPPTTNVPPLTARAGLRRLAVAAAVVLAVVVVVASFIAVLRLGGRV